MNSSKHNPKIIKHKKFNEVLKQFIFELTKQFPEDIEVKQLNKKFKMTKDFKWIEVFMAHIEEFGKMIMEKDEELFNNNFIVGLNLKNYYQRCNDHDKDVVWIYLQTLYMIGCSYHNYSPEFLNKVEEVSQNLNEEQINSQN